MHKATNQSTIYYFFYIVMSLLMHTISNPPTSDEGESTAFREESGIFGPTLISPPTNSRKRRGDAKNIVCWRLMEVVCQKAKKGSRKKESAKRMRGANGVGKWANGQ
ncbi:hypothetical protein CEXT_364791 [Caerostris extrusa]|uniref:Secreted protein n=1 Tax=Caerostris extrusa TaxID=172846 RepID=A0AAV4X7V2_CAEEX|nr:hypothetical protein CEXT_364791 [Caerostris extrusa]